MHVQLPLFIDSQLAALQETRQQLSTSILAASTLKSYQHDWKLFAQWCTSVGRVERPASSDTISLFLTDQIANGCKVTTARRRWHAINHFHRSYGIEPAGRLDAIMLMRSAQRQRLERPRRVRPLTIAEIGEISDALMRDGSPRAVRDRAVMLVGFASALRRSSLVALTLDDLEFTPEGALLTILREKQDQEGKGRFVAIPPGKHLRTCSVSALRAWLAIRPKTESPRIFLAIGKGRRPSGINPECIATIVKRSAFLIGRDPRYYGAHSLRAGFITAAGEAGQSDLMIAEHSGHRDMNVLRSYVRRTNAFRANACAALDL